MPDSRRTWAALAALYANNTAGAISPQDLRDGFASIKPHVASDAPTASDDETLGFDVGHAWIDTSTNPRSVYECVDPTTGNAVWVKRYPQDGGGGAGVEAFTDLSDAPSDYTGSGGKLVAVTAGADGLEFVDPPNAPDLTGLLPKLASVRGYAANASLDEEDDLGAYVRVTGAATITLPDGFPAGWQCVIVNATDAAEVALSAATTLTLPSGFDPTIQNRRAVTVIHVGSNAWEAHGALVEEEA